MNVQHTQEWIRGETSRAGPGGFCVIEANQLDRLADDLAAISSSIDRQNKRLRVLRAWMASHGVWEQFSADRLHAPDNWFTAAGDPR